MDSDPEVAQTLNEIVELGHVSVRDGKVLTATPPKYNLCHFKWDRWTPTLKYISDYAKHHPDTFNGDFFVCLYDGWREYSTPAWPNNFPPEFMPWSHPKVKKHHYISQGRAGEPRFRHSVMAPSAVYPELVLPVLTYNKHACDRSAICIPDAEFIESQYTSFVSQVWNSDTPWESKRDVAFWRGSINTTSGHEYDYLGTGGMHPRSYITSVSGREMPIRVDAGFAHSGVAPISVQLQNKYLFDIDGMVNAWSGLYWKLLSNSVVLKHRSHWQQWYYPKLRAWEHYVPITDFRNLSDTLQWCKNNDAQCKQIAENGRELVKTLTYEYAVQEYEML